MSRVHAPEERRQEGHRIQAQVAGRKPPEPQTPLEESWRDFVFAEVWSRPGMDRRSRYLVSIAGAALGGDQNSLDGYVHGALEGGELSLSELREAALHLAVYGGWSSGGEVDRAVSRAADSLGLPAAECPPIRARAWDPDTRVAEGAAEFEKVMTFPGTPPIAPYLEAISNFVFGEMWCRSGLDQRSRRWITLVGVCESSTEIPIKTHIHAAMASGNCTPDEMQEFVLQYGIHAGWPKASLVQAVVFEMIQKVADGLPWNHGGITAR